MLLGSNPGRLRKRLHKLPLALKSLTGIFVRFVFHLIDLFSFQIIFLGRNFGVGNQGEAISGSRQRFPEWL